MDKPTALFCTCNSEAIVVTPLGDGEVSLVMFDWRGGGSSTWAWRLRHIWRILTIGHPYTDDVILSTEDARKLADILSAALLASGSGGAA